MKAIVTRDLTKRFGDLVAVDQVDLEIESGELFGMLGPNGAGKTTLMRVLTTFLCPSQGTADIGGYDILEQPIKVRELVGYLPENVPLYMDRRVDEYLAFVGNARGIDGEALQNQIGRAHV